MKVSALDHLVLTVRDLDATVDFYAGVLGMTPVTFAGGRRALAFGSQKLNLHEVGHEFEPKAVRPTPGSADFCLLTDTPLDEADALVDCPECGEAASSRRIATWGHCRACRTAESRATRPLRW